ncbi:MAG: hypothetical protein CME66_02650 [Halobacteriovoraceae bacterium]|nr:hypothetical protein [Halobacteriovoraceae bacterium]
MPKGSSVTTPNKEQLAAIEHSGGVLLKAGAGSGKTFVLKEHMLYLAGKWIDEFKQDEQKGSFDLFIKSKFRSIVLMTFTKKAAGELEIRLIQAFEEKALLGDLKDYWKVLKNNLDYLNISTIHGFCYKLIKQGFFKGVSAEQDILSESEFKETISGIFSSWLEQNAAKHSRVYDVILKDKNNILSSLCSIFSDPTLRNYWNEIDINHYDEHNVDTSIDELLYSVGIKDFLDEEIEMSLFSEFEDKKLCQVYLEFLKQKKGFQCDLDSVLKMQDFFEQRNFKIPAKPSAKTTPPELIESYERFKYVKDFLKKNGEHFKKYHEHFEHFILPWFQAIKELVDFVENEYSCCDGVTFSDLEYIVYQGLKDKKTSQEISKQYQYFIVDEFQDTSYIQFSILENIIQKDYQRLFCVGDLKQAIYGFRGGELGVFLACEKKIPKNLSLANNYRSSANIINFNNVFFDFIFQAGHNYQGHDSYAVPVAYQEVPSTQEESGEINLLKTQIDFLADDEKLSNADVDYIEALALLKKIESLHAQNDEVAILYKRLKPSLILIDLLIKNEIGFTAQIKIPFLEDPICGIFYELLANQFDENEKKDAYLFYSLKAYISLLGGVYEKDVYGQLITEFYKNINYYGLYHSFCNFVYKLGFKNSNYKNNLGQLKILIETTHGNISELLKLLMSQYDSSYSLDFQYGQDPDSVKIMTTHGSKGLQFQHVLVGGLYTNENFPTMKSLIGKLPCSFKWSESIHGKNKFKTPEYLLEEELTKHKEFSESKRLFYVANTRAQKTLSFVEIDFSHVGRTKKSSGSWWSAFEIWREQNKTFKAINEQNLDISDDFQKSYLEKIDIRKPLFHIDNLGLQVMTQTQSLFILPELSITKLATLADCPRKFYLKNICKVSEEELDLVKLKPDLYAQTKDLSEPSLSSAGRGTLIHEILSEILKSEFQRKVDDFSLMKSSDRENLNWVVDKLKKYVDKYKIISEKPIKFELLNYMVSGIPDLVLYSNDKVSSSEVWDFKTGRFSENKLKSYYFQLFCYAFAQYILHEVPKDQQIKLVICFVDEQKIVDKTVSYTDVENYLNAVCEEINRPDLENEEHCAFCPYKIICQKS